MNALEIVKLSKSYLGKRLKRVDALQDLSLEVRTGEVFGFLGPNGAGKSTTIKTVMGQIKPTTGHATIFDRPATESSSRLRVGYLPENPSFYDFLTGREYLHFVGNTFSLNNSTITEQSEHVLELLELAHAADRPIKGYSKGMVQRLGLAQAMLHDPDLYILDEPMSGLDPLGRALVKEIIKNLKQQGKTIFFSTHITADIEVVCDRVGIIARGKLMAVDTVENILQSGIEGYQIQVSRHGHVEELLVAKDRLKDFMAELVSSDAVVERIEPKRKDMEAFFLDIVSKEKHSAQ